MNDLLWHVEYHYRAEAYDRTLPGRWSEHDPDTWLPAPWARGESLRGARRILRDIQGRTGFVLRPGSAPGREAARMTQAGSAPPVSDVFRKGPIELRLGDYRDVLSDVEPDAVITDPPYSERTHSGYRSATDYKAKPQIRPDTDTERERLRALGRRTANITKARNQLPYAPITEPWTRNFAGFWASRNPKWIVCCGDHRSCRWWETAFTELEWVTFPPVIWVRTNSAPRFTGDGPANAAEHIAVARPRGLPEDRRSRPGYYVGSIHAEKIVVGGKPIPLMRAFVRDYSRPGDLVCDPCAGGATTLIAAALEGRRAIGAELDPETYAKACARIERTALTPPLPGLEREPMDGRQEGFDLG